MAPHESRSSPDLAGSASGRRSSASGSRRRRGSASGSRRSGLVRQASDHGLRSREVPVTRRSGLLDPNGRIRGPDPEDSQKNKVKKLGQDCMVENGEPIKFNRWQAVLSSSRPAGVSCTIQNVKGFSSNKDAQWGHVIHQMGGLKVDALHPGRGDQVDALFGMNVQDLDKAQPTDIFIVKPNMKGSAGMKSWHRDNLLLKKCKHEKELLKEALKHHKSKACVPAGGDYEAKPATYYNRNQLCTVEDVVFANAKGYETKTQELKGNLDRIHRGAAGMRDTQFKPPPRRPPTVKPMQLHKKIFLDNEPEIEEKDHSTQVLPTIFLSHGSGAMPLMWPAQHPGTKCLRELAGKHGLSPNNVRCILVISAHWETKSCIEVSHHQGHQSLEYDYSGYPNDCYKLQYAPVGMPQVTGLVVDLLVAHGIPARRNNHRKLDHGVFVPLCMVAGLDEVPVVQMSLPWIQHNENDNARFALHIGSALRSLRSEGILIVGSGMTLKPDSAAGDMRQCGEWVSAVKKVIRGPPAKRGKILERWATELPHARVAHGREEHWLPLLICSGAAAGDQGSVIGDFWEGHMNISHFKFGESPRTGSKSVRPSTA